MIKKPRRNSGCNKLHGSISTQTKNHIILQFGQKPHDHKPQNNPASQANFPRKLINNTPKTYKNERSITDHGINQSSTTTAPMITRYRTQNARRCCCCWLLIYTTFIFGQRRAVISHFAEHFAKTHPHQRAQLRHQTTTTQTTTTATKANGAAATESEQR